MASFEELKAKYQSVLEVIEEEQVSVKNLHLQDDKLFIKGVAPSLEAANKVWDAIKRVNPSANDITADFPVDTSMQVQRPAQPQQETEQEQPTSNVRTYTVKSGDTLSKISKQFYGSPGEYMKIFNANRDQLADPDKIKVGQELKIPAA
jgi:cell envelope opacity-associated protein A